MTDENQNQEENNRVPSNHLGDEGAKNYDSQNTDKKELSKAKKAVLGGLVGLGLIGGGAGITYHVMNSRNAEQVSGLNAEISELKKSLLNCDSDVAQDPMYYALMEKFGFDADNRVTALKFQDADSLGFPQGFAVNNEVYVDQLKSHPLVENDKVYQARFELAAKGETPKDDIIQPSFNLFLNNYSTHEFEQVEAHIVTSLTDAKAAEKTATAEATHKLNKELQKGGAPKELVQGEKESDVLFAVRMKEYKEAETAWQEIQKQVSTNIEAQTKKEVAIDSAYADLDSLTAQNYKGLSKGFNTEFSETNFLFHKGDLLYVGKEDGKELDTVSAKIKSAADLFGGFKAEYNTLSTVLDAEENTARSLFNAKNDLATLEESVIGKKAEYQADDKESGKKVHTMYFEEKRIDPLLEEITTGKSDADSLLKVQVKADIDAANEGYNELMKQYAMWKNTSATDLMKDKKNWEALGLIKPAEGDSANPIDSSLCYQDDFANLVKPNKNDSMYIGNDSLFTADSLAYEQNKAKCEADFEAARQDKITEIYDGILGIQRQLEDDSDIYKTVDPKEAERATDITDKTTGSLSHGVENDDYKITPREDKKLDAEASAEGSIDNKVEDAPVKKKATDKSETGKSEEGNEEGYDAGNEGLPADSTSDNYSDSTSTSENIPEPEKPGVEKIKAGYTSENATDTLYTAQDVQTAYDNGNLKELVDGIAVKDVMLFDDLNNANLSTEEAIKAFDQATDKWHGKINEYIMTKQNADMVSDALNENGLNGLIEFDVQGNQALVGKVNDEYKLISIQHKPTMNAEK